LSRYFSFFIFSDIEATEREGVAASLDPRPRSGDGSAFAAVLIHARFIFLPYIYKKKVLQKVEIMLHKKNNEIFLVKLFKKH
jgi:hypothetical protein